MDEQRDDDGIQAGHARGLGRRKYPGIDAAEDDDRQAQRPAPLPGGLSHVRKRELAAFADAETARGVIDVERHQRGHQQAGQDAADEQVADRFLGRDAVEDHGDRRRDDDVDGAGRRQESARDRDRIALLQQRRIEHPADRRDRGGARAGNRAEHRAGANRGQAEAAANAAEQRQHPVHQPLRNAARRHDRAGQHEERHRNQVVVVGAAEQLGLDQAQRQIEHVDEGHRRRRHQHREDRHAHHQQDDGQQNHCPDHAGLSVGAAPPLCIRVRISWIDCATSRITMATNETGMTV